MDRTLLDVTISAVTSWAIALAPALLLRYAFCRRPLSRKASKRWAFGIGFVLFLVVVASTPTEDVANAGPVVLMGLLSYWILKAGGEEDLKSKQPIKIK